MASIFPFRLPRKEKPYNWEQKGKLINYELQKREPTELKPKKEKPNIKRRYNELVNHYKNYGTFLSKLEDIQGTRKSKYVCEICDSIVVKDRYNVPLSCGNCIKLKTNSIHLKKKLEEYLIETETK